LVPIYQSPRRHIPTFLGKARLKHARGRMWEIHIECLSKNRTNCLMRHCLRCEYLGASWKSCPGTDCYYLGFSRFSSVPQKNTRKVPRDCFLLLLASSLLNIVQSFDAIQPWLLAMLKLSLFMPWRHIGEWKRSSCRS
jgi:hypothetical protein